MTGSVVPRPVRRRTRVKPAALAGAAVTMALVLAACGSQLDPDTVARAGGGAGVQGGVVNPDGTVSGADGLASDGGDPGDATGGGAGGSGGSGGGSTGGSAGGSTGGSGGGSTGGSSGGSGGGTSGSGDNAATGGTKAASCAGLKNQTGVTDDTITIGNTADISGPVPGLFEASQDAVKAYVAYFNSTSDICGRKLKLATYDSRTDASADQQVYTKACDEVFAMVGATSAFDSGGAATAQGCGLPDIRSASLTTDRAKCSTCFGAQSTNSGEFENSVPDFLKKTYGSAAQHAGFLYINAGASSENAISQAKAMTKRGMHFDVIQGVDISEFNYAPFVQQLKDKKVEVVFWTGAYQQSVRLRQTMQQQGYTPKVYLRDPTDYIPDYVSSGGSAVDGTVVYTNFTPFEEAGKNKEMQLYLSWLRQVRPGAAPTFFGVFSWSAARLFVEKAIGLGGRLTRPNMVAALKKTDNWTSNGLTAPQHVGPKRTGDCWRYIQLKGGKWSAIGGTKYTCTGTTFG